MRVNRRRLNRSSAKRTIGMRTEPHIDTLRMKIVLTVWKRTAHITVGELRQANGAVVNTTAGGGGGEDKSRNRFENGRVKTFFFKSGGCKRLLRELTVAAAIVAEVDISTKENDDDYEYEEKDRRAYHDFGVKGILSLKVWVRSH
ncbi:hypothetical protein TSUD_342320 [Trifolium subterraneum]|nr:hypothetical protein TSUD_342320 [Trifolium subterraneum]